MQRTRTWIYIAAGALVALAALFFLLRSAPEPEPAAASRAAAPTTEPAFPPAAREAPRGGAQIAGTVRDSAGRPAAGAVVAALDPDGERTLRSAAVGADGAFSLDVEPGDYTVRAGADGFLPAQKRSRAPALGVELVLHREAVINGRITGPAAEVARASAHLNPGEVFPPEGTLAATQARAVAATPRSDDAMLAGDTVATFRFGGLAPGQYRVWADAPASGSKKQELTLLEGATVSVDFLLETGATISGRTITPEGDPVAGASLHLAPPGYDRRINEFPDRVAERARSGADGRFAIANAQPGRAYRIYARHPSRQEATADLEAPADVTLVLEPKGEPGKGRIAGRVLGPDGKPVAGAKVRWEELKAIKPPSTKDWTKLDHSGVHRGIRSLDDGSYDTSVAPGRYRVIIEADGYLPTSVESVMVRDGEKAAGVDFKLDPGASVRGRVLDDTRAPIAGARVIVWDSGFRSYELRAGADGTFATTGLFSETALRVRAGFPGYAATEAQVPAGGAVDLVCARVGALRGAVASAASGAPVAKFHVQIEYLEGWAPIGLVTPVQTRTFDDPAGRFEVNGLDPGRYKVTPLVPGATNLAGPFVIVEVPPAGTAEVALTLP